VDLVNSSFEKGNLIRRTSDDAGWFERAKISVINFLVKNQLTNFVVKNFVSTIGARIIAKFFEYEFSKFPKLESFRIPFY
jgi:hypothetical protein